MNRNVGYDCIGLAFMIYPTRIVKGITYAFRGFAKDKRVRDGYTLDCYLTAWSRIYLIPDQSAT